MNIKPHLDGEEMVEQAYEIEKKRVYYPPYTLDPEKATFEDIKTHALTRQPISESTAKKYLELAALMETHQHVPVNFKHPHWTNFFEHMDFIKIHEQATPNMLKNRRKAWMMFCRAWGINKEWPTYTLPHIPDRTKNIRLPRPETVYQILHHKYTGDKYKNKLIQYHFFLGFMIGMRPEKEMIILKIDDLQLDEYDNYTIRIVSPKIGGAPRILQIEDFIAISKTRMCCKNYVDKIRPRFANRNEDALLINPKTGKNWTEDQLRHQLLNRYGKRAWHLFYPYIMRHWAGTARCIEWEKDYKVLKRLNYWMGHSPKRLEQTLHYLDLTSLYNKGKGSWLRRALTRYNQLGGKHGLSSKEQKTGKKKRFVQISPGDSSNPHGSALS